MESQRSGMNTEQTLDFLAGQEFPSRGGGLCRVGGGMYWEAGVLAVLSRRQQGESPSTSQSAHSWVPTI